MSQAKVDQYKKEKANRKKTIVRDNIKRRCAIVAAWIVVIAIVGWAGASVYTLYENSKPAQTFTADTTAITDYLNDLAAEDAE